jgi:hypothetical protein
VAHLEFHHSLDQRHGATSRYVDQSALSSRVHPFEKRTTFATIASKDHGIAIAKIPATPGCPGRRTGWCSCCCHGPRFVGPDWERNDAPERSKRRQTELGPGHADFDSPGVVRRPRHRNASGSLAIALYTLPIRRCHCRGTEHRSDSVFVWGQWRWQPIHRSVRAFSMTVLNNHGSTVWPGPVAYSCPMIGPTRLAPGTQVIATGTWPKSVVTRSGSRAAPPGSYRVIIAGRIALSIRLK